ncbi:MAG: DUF420 domain-containing protein [Sulfobacillus thermosulfidooxidans]|uniref:DUF420 domain-containing protein n=1 Tax=Sulfobacillus TaxID=28033 RepID=UPI000CD28DCC|nr:DUF420 domain-containing protein [Sulfobacillus sp. hq2]POB09813.1 hypothetical protein CO251_13000 [Sulfobacillus sp. hq2]PSR36934.1 MAG: DUF420 domain-containing protein [Sulfobacillus thermosulfidooxidans]
MGLSGLWGLFNEIVMIASATLVAIGWYFIRHKQVEVHRKFMLSGATLGAVFFVSYLLSTFLVGDTFYGGPAKYNASYQIFLLIHILLATAAAVMGVITLRYALSERFNKHRKIAPWTATFWFIAAITGLAVFLLLFVIFPPGPTTKSLIQIIIGH